MNQSQNSKPEIITFSGQHSVTHSLLLQPASYLQHKQPSSLFLIAPSFVSCALVFSFFSSSCSSCFQESYMAPSPRLFTLCTLLSFLLRVQTPTEILLLWSAGVKHPQPLNKVSVFSVFSNVNIKINNFMWMTQISSSVFFPVFNILDRFHFFNEVQALL